MNETIPMYVESPRGHDTLNIPNTPVDVQNAVESQLQDGKWVTVEQKDGSSEILTAKDVPTKVAEANNVLSENSDKIIDEAEKVDIDKAKEVVAKPEQPKSDLADDDLGDLDLDDVAKKSNDSWKSAFKQTASAKPTTATKSKATKPKEEWEDKFKEVKSATATHKAKGG